MLDIKRVRVLDRKRDRVLDWGKEREGEIRSERERVKKWVCMCKRESKQERER